MLSVTFQGSFHNIYNNCATVAIKKEAREVSYQTTGQFSSKLVQHITYSLIMKHVAEHNILS